jgi:hypothetical protein
MHEISVRDAYLNWATWRSVRGMSEAAWGRRPLTPFGIRPSVTLSQIDGRAVADTQFLKSMIPHHAGAILMFEKAPISGADVKELCQKTSEPALGDRANEAHAECGRQLSPAPHTVQLFGPRRRNRDRR